MIILVHLLTTIREYEYLTKTSFIFSIKHSINFRRLIIKIIRHPNLPFPFFQEQLEELTSLFPQKHSYYRQGMRAISLIQSAL